MNEARTSIEPLLRRTRAVAWRIRASRGSRAFATLGATGISTLALARTLDVVVGLPGEGTTIAAAIGLGSPLLGALVSASRAIPPLLPARLIDRTHALSGRVAVAVELAQSATEDPLAQLAVADAAARADGILPARAFPLAAPPHLRALLLACVALAVAVTIEPPRAEGLPPTPAVARLEPLLVHPDDLGARREAVERIGAGADPTEELQRALDATNALLEALEDRSVDRTEAMRRIAALEEALSRPRPPALVAREEALTAMGDRLGRGQLTEALSEALRDHDAGGAAEALRDLAERTRASALSAAERRALREALEELASMRETEERRAELEEAEAALAQQRAETPDPQEESLLRREEEVARQREQHEQRMQAERELERLQRELDEAAEELGETGEEQEAAESMEDAAEDLNRTAREQAGEEEMEQLREQLRQLREMLRRQRRQTGSEGAGEGEGQGRDGGGDRGGASAMDRFVLRARGGGEGADGLSLGVPSGSGGGGEGESQGASGEGGEQPAGTPGGASGEQPGADGDGGEGGESEAQMLVLGAGGDAILELPGFGQGRGARSGGGQGDDGPGDGAGSRHEDGTTDDPTDRAGDHRTVTVHGDDQGRGPSRSEVIRGGAARGFASRDYERVYADYAHHAEQEIEEDEIPPGYRFYVRRYFELIRPRD